MQRRPNGSLPTVPCPRCERAISRVNLTKHLKICKGPKSQTTPPPTTTNAITKSTKRARQTSDDNGREHDVEEEAEEEEGERGVVVDRDGRGSKTPTLPRLVIPPTPPTNGRMTMNMIITPTASRIRTGSGSETETDDEGNGVGAPRHSPRRPRTPTQPLPSLRLHHPVPAVSIHSMPPFRPPPSLLPPPPPPPRLPSPHYQYQVPPSPSWKRFALECAADADEIRRRRDERGGSDIACAYERDVLLNSVFVMLDAIMESLDPRIDAREIIETNLKRTICVAVEVLMVRHGMITVEALPTLDRLIHTIDRLSGAYDELRVAFIPARVRLIQLRGTCSDVEPHHSALQDLTRCMGKLTKLAQRGFQMRSLMLTQLVETLTLALEIAQGTHLDGTETLRAVRDDCIRVINGTIGHIEQVMFPSDKTPLFIELSHAIRRIGVLDPILQAGIELKVRRLQDLLQL